MVELSARLIPCNFKDKDGNELYRVVVDHNDKVDSGTIAEETAAKTRLERPLVEIVSKTLTGVMMSELAKGKRIETEFFSIYITCKGRFVGPDDTFDPKRHALQIRITPKAKAKAMLKNVKIVNVLQPLATTITIIRCEGVTEDDTIRLGVNTYMNGKNVAMSEGREDEGVFLLDKEGNVVATATVGESDVGTVNALFASGAVEPGEYIYEIRTRNRQDVSRRVAVARRNVTVIA